MKTYQHTLFIRARLGNLSVADLGGRVETFDIYVFCPLTTNKVPPRPAPAGDSGSMETPLDIIIYGALVTLETK